MTLSELATLLLRDIGEIGATETPSAADSTFVQGKISRAHARLVELDLAPWDIAAVPDYAAEAVVQYAIPSVAPAYGYPIADPLGYERTALARIRELVQTRRASEPGTAVYF